MTAPGLTNCAHKLQWAKRHMEYLKGEIAAFHKLHACRIEAKADLEALKYTFYIHDIPDAPPDWGLVIGDCIHNLRSCLDHLAYQLALLGQGRPLTDRRRVQFPIYSDPVKFKKHGIQGIELLRVSEQTRIEELQPYNGRYFLTYDCNPAPGAIPWLLAELNRLNNIDKHRTVHPTWNVADAYGRRPNLPVDRQWKSGSTTNQVLKDGAQIGYWQYETSLPDLTDVDVKAQFPIGITLDEGDPFSLGFSNVTELLRAMSSAVAEVVSLFIPCFQGGHPPRELSRPN